MANSAAASFNSNQTVSPFLWVIGLAPLTLPRRTTLPQKKSVLLLCGRSHTSDPTSMASSSQFARIIKPCGGNEPFWCAISPCALSPPSIGSHLQDVVSPRSAHHAADELSRLPHQAIPPEPIEEEIPVCSVSAQANRTSVTHDNPCAF
jgi:hypothetical protein